MNIQNYPQNLISNLCFYLILIYLLINQTRGITSRLDIFIIIFALKILEYNRYFCYKQLLALSVLLIIYLLTLILDGGQCLFCIISKIGNQSLI